MNIIKKVLRLSNSHLFKVSPQNSQEFLLNDPPIQELLYDLCSELHCTRLYLASFAYIKIIINLIVNIDPDLDRKFDLYKGFPEPE